MTKELIKIESKDEKLNEKQITFVNHLLIDGMDATQAYMKAYKVDRKSVASAAASRLMKKEVIKAELSSLSNQLLVLSQVPKHTVVTKLRSFLERMEGDLDNPNNRKFYLEALDMTNKMMGYYQHNTTVTKINIKGGLDFGGWSPDSSEPIEINDSEAVIISSEEIEAELHSSDDLVDWDPESEDIDGNKDGDTMPF